MTRQHISRRGSAAVALICAAVAAFSVSFVGGCAGNAPKPADPAACWRAMVAQYQHDVATGATGTYPPECRGVPVATIQSYAFQILAGNTESPTP